MISSLQKTISRRFRAILCGDPSGQPPWLDAIAAGEGAGFYLPNEAPWIIHSDMATMVGGIRALLLQALHPGSLKGVRSHSRYKEDPLGRLAGTIQWLTITTFASRESILAEAARVRAMHHRVKGTYQAADGRSRSYSAGDTDLLLWVHLAFTDSFLRCHQTYSSRAIPGGADSYVELWAQSVEPLGLTEAPRSEKELQEVLDNFQDELIVTEETRDVIYWLRHPPLPLVARLFYRLLYAAAYATLPEHCRRMIGKRAAPLWIIRPVINLLLKGMRIAIGPEDPLQEAALERLQRSGIKYTTI